MSATMSPTSIEQSVRADFPILATRVNGQPLVYLDNAATSQKPQFVIDAVTRYYETQNANVHRGVHHLSQIATHAFDASREKVRILLNAATAPQVIFTKGSTEAVNLVAAGIELEAGDTILVSTMEHHSNIVPWQIRAQKVGAQVLPIPISDAGEIDLEAYEKLLRENRVRMVGVVHVSNSLGTVNPVKRMAEMAHAAGALILVDGAQAGPHLRIDVQDLDADFYTLSCHKIYAPTGVGVLYGKLDLLEALPPYQGGGDMIRTVSFEGTTYAPLPAKFEAGTPHVAGVIGLGAAIDYLADLASRLDASVAKQDLSHRLDAAFAWIGRRERDLTEYGTKLLSDIPDLKWTGTAPDKAGILAFTLKGAHPHDIGTILDSEGIAIRAGHHCCMPLMKRMNVPATARASISFMNSFEEIDRLAEGVRKVREIFS